MVWCRTRLFEPRGPGRMSPEELVTRAVPWIRHCFGAQVLWRTEEVVGGDETVVRVVIEVPDMLAGEAGLQCLEERFAVSSGGNVVFDYEVTGHGGATGAV
jgi:hypothetical protein